ncbi:unnamed protein product (macronuclear) [Paramecium tetraurelia]|uniref:Uncharacterized protein n=1 Tax=Paramecium tetraurelia TaxID=5888 RepID=A0D6E6_PARTE|nr:uncharacterized protein GSPATT00001654001 [Paramecium tetraurelia]CAK78613.1 unnamed protein product [Paramecium tetraurelia]|eukprot:XP_001446010.1 hypothetical protein (macronuclear) [Paramecium tetraurelia strain d4-2]
MKQQTLHPDPRKKQILLDMINKGGISEMKPEKTLQAQIEAMQMKLQEKDQELNQKEEQIDKLCAVIFQYQEELTQKNREMEDLQLSKAQLEMEVQNYVEMKEHCDHALKQLHHVEMQMSELQEQNSQLKNQEQQLLSQIQALQKNSDVLLRDAFEREKKQLHKKLLEKTKIIQELNCQLQKQNETQSTIHQSMMKMKEDHRRQEQTIQQLREEIENLKGDGAMFANPLNQLTSPQGQRQASFNTHKDFDTPMRQSSYTQQKPQSSNSLCSNFTSQESKKKMMGSFKRLTTMAVGMYSNLLDYSSLQNGSKLASELSQARIDLTQQVSRASLLHQEYNDNN